MTALTKVVNPTNTRPKSMVDLIVVDDSSLFTFGGSWIVVEGYRDYQQSALSLSFLLLYLLFSFPPPGMRQRHNEQASELLDGGC
jgi:hypothetical protein